MNLINIGIEFEDGTEAFFGQKMYIGTGYLLFKASYNGCSENDIADGRKTQYQKFHTSNLLIF